MGAATGLVLAVLGGLLPGDLGGASPSPAAVAAETPGWTPVPLADVVDTRHLELVNRDHAVDSLPADADLVSMIGVVPTPPGATSIRLTPAAAQATDDLFAAAREATGGTLMLTSGFRGLERQGELWADATDPRYVMPPGHSEHHTGLAIDVQAPGTPLGDLTNTPQGRWVVENSWRFGLVLRYPDGSEPVTGVAFEPWHFRYVGRVHAASMTEHGLLLEEYLELLRDTGGITVEVDGAEHTVSYQTPHDGTLLVPADGEWQASSDNLGGFVITARQG